MDGSVKNTLQRNSSSTHHIANKALLRIRELNSHTPERPSRHRRKEKTNEYEF